jgi:hypothetical protein
MLSRFRAPIVGGAARKELKFFISFLSKKEILPHLCIVRLSLQHALHRTPRAPE